MADNTNPIPITRYLTNFNPSVIYQTSIEFGYKIVICPFQADKKKILIFEYQNQPLNGSTYSTPLTEIDRDGSEVYIKIGYTVSYTTVDDKNEAVEEFIFLAESGRFYVKTAVEFRSLDSRRTALLHAEDTFKSGHFYSGLQMFFAISSQNDIFILNTADSSLDAVIKFGTNISDLFIIKRNQFIGVVNGHNNSIYYFFVNQLRDSSEHWAAIPNAFQFEKSWSCPPNTNLNPETENCRCNINTFQKVDFSNISCLPCDESCGSCSGPGTSQNECFPKTGCNGNYGQLEQDGSCICLKGYEDKTTNYCKVC